MLFKILNSFFDKWFDTKHLFFNKFVGNLKNNQIEKYPFSDYFPLVFYSYFAEDPYIYISDNNYHLSTSKIFIKPLINKIYLSKKVNDIELFHNYTDVFNKYDSSFPLWLVLLIENIKDYENIIIEINKIIFTEEYKFEIDKIKENQLIKLYNNHI